MRVFLCVIDSFGVGELPDAHEFNDQGSNTFLNIFKSTNLSLPFLFSLGLKNIDGLGLEKEEKLIGSFAKLSEKTKAKDTTAGHYELAGIVLEKPYPTFPNAFPKQFVERLEKECGVKFIGNEVASGTEIIARLGDLHFEKKAPILYTSQDSVLQIACAEEIFPLEKIYEICEKVRVLCSGEYNVARVIARPFIKTSNGYVRTENRRDFALSPPQKSMLDKLKENGFDVLSVGKIYDIFTGCGITKSFKAKNNIQSLNAIEECVKLDFNGLCFANLVDTDMLYGHRNNVQGYADALEFIDSSLSKIAKQLNDDDILIVTGDHGCDPTTISTDHSREYVPLLIYGKKLKSGVNLGTIEGFDCVSKAILDEFGVEKDEKSLLRKLK